LLGERANRGLIRSGKDSCTVEAVFDLQKPAKVNVVLKEAGLLIIRRVIGASGGN
jgi:DNA repair protein RecN (Recombination protein N)